MKHASLIAQGLPDSDRMSVTCGLLEATLHRDKFYCPGIHRECIELPNGSFVSPKKFMIMGDKGRLKDWKNAVRYKGVQLRKYLDAGILQFANHDKLCTGRCVARAPATPLKTDEAINRLTEQALSSHFDRQVLEMNGQAWSESDGEDVKPDLKSLQRGMASSPLAPSSSGNGDSNLSQPDDSALEVPHPVSMTSVNASSMSPLRVGPSQTVTQACLVPEADLPVEFTEEDLEDQKLWKGITELGLIDEFFREIKANLDIFKNNMVRRFVPLQDSKRISTIVKQLGIMQKLKYKLSAHQTDMERQRMKLDKEYQDLQRRMKEYEQKKSFLDLKSKRFNQLLDSSKTLRADFGNEDMFVVNSEPAETSHIVMVTSDSPQFSPQRSVSPSQGVLTSLLRNKQMGKCSDSLNFTTLKEEEEAHNMKNKRKRSHKDVMHIDAEAANALSVDSDDDEVGEAYDLLEGDRKRERHIVPNHIPIDRDVINCVISQEVESAIFPSEDNEDMDCEQPGMAGETTQDAKEGESEPMAESFIADVQVMVSEEDANNGNKSNIHILSSSSLSAVPPNEEDDTSETSLGLKPAESRSPTKQGDQEHEVKATMESGSDATGSTDIQKSSDNDTDLETTAVRRSGSGLKRGARRGGRRK